MNSIKMRRLNYQATSLIALQVSSGHGGRVTLSRRGLHS
jgi:hypothetical protein